MSTRGLDLLAAHCASLDPAVPSARERLDAVLGRDLARMLVFALSTGGAPERGRAALGAGVVLAA